MLQVFVTLVVAAACITAMLSAASLQDKRTVKGIDIRIKNEQYGFIDKQEVKNMLFENHINISKTSIAKIDAHKIEQTIDTNPWVADAQVYLDNGRLLHIYLTQRVPVARLFDQSGNSYYLDASLKKMPLSEKYIHYTTVVTNMPVFNNDSMDKAFKGEVVSLVKYIERDSFWSAQVSQVIVTDDRTFELVPVLGNQRIIFGDTSMMVDKFNNLFAFYKKVLNRVGWDKYEVLDLRFAGQVVASPALPWKIPVDKALTNMNWVKSIIGKDTVNAAPDMPGDSTAAVAIVPAATPKQITQPVLQAAINKNKAKQNTTQKRKNNH
jgi:cell division protein FtsQ